MLGVRTVEIRFESSFGHLGIFCVDSNIQLCQLYFPLTLLSSLTRVQCLDDWKDVAWKTLSLLADVATRPGNYGPPNTWTQEDLFTIGVVAAGLKPELIESLTVESMGGMHPLAIKSMPLATFQKLSLDQISKLPYDAAIMVDSEELSNEQSAALKRATVVQSEDFNVPPEFVVEFPQVTSPIDDLSVTLITKSVNESESDSGVSGRAGGSDDDLVLIVVTNENGTMGSNNTDGIGGSTNTTGLENDVSGSNSAGDGAHPEQEKAPASASSPHSSHFLKNSISLIIIYIYFGFTNC